MEGSEMGNSTPRSPEAPLIQSARAWACEGARGCTRVWRGLGSAASATSVPSPLASGSPRLGQFPHWQILHWGSRENKYLETAYWGTWGKLCANITGAKQCANYKLFKIPNECLAHISYFAIYDIYQLCKREMESLQDIGCSVLQMRHCSLKFSMAK